MKTKLFFRNLIMLFVVVFVTCDIQAAKYIWDMNTIQTTTQHICSSFPVSADTIVIYKPSGWPVNVTDWQIFDASYTIVSDVDAQDSVVFLPTTAQTFYITAYYNGITKYMWLNVHSAPPSHATFELPLGGGQINSANDTVWSCSNTIFVGTPVDGNEATSWYWGNTTGFYSVDAPVTITTSGTYFYHRTNPCGITIDTFEVVMLPTVLPVWQDTSFCNTPVSLTLDPGPGWNYSWVTGAVSQTIYVDTAGTYTVNLTNACTSGVATAVVEYQSYPIPDLQYLQGSPMCTDSILILDPSPGYMYDTYQWQWSGGTATTPTLSISGLTTGTGMYYVTVTQGNCTADAYGSFDFFNAPLVPEICVVTVNPVLNKNMIVWTSDEEPMPGDPQYSQCSFYNLYKWAGGTNWILLGNTPVDQDHIFTDMTSSPPTVSARYKITRVDECGIESMKSSYHQTILLSVMAGANPGEIPLIWTPYDDESNTFVVDQYQIWRGNHPDSLEFYAETPFTSYNDTGVYVQKYYQIVVTRLGGCESSPAGFKGGEKSLIAGSSSNITNNIVTGISDNQSFINVSVYPNPSTGIFRIEGTKISHVEVMDGAGKLLLITDQPTIDLSDCAPGFYIATVYTNQGSTTRKLLRY